jgi:DNA polymerase-3 subunit delta
VIYSLTGENAFGLTQELHRLVGAFVSEHGDLALERLDGEEVTFERMQAALTSLPFLANKKMVVLRAPSANKQFTDVAPELLQGVPETTNALLIEPKLDKRLTYYKFLKKHTEFKEFPALDINGLSRWLAQAAKAAGGTLSTGDAHYLVERVGTNQQILFNELQKLLTNTPNITRETINLLTEPTPQSTIFQLLDAAFAGESDQALRLYAEQRALKVEPQQLIAMLTWQLHILALIKTAGERSPEQLAKESKLNPYVVKKSLRIANRLSLVRLKELVAKLMELDVAAKRSSLDIDEALQLYLLTLAD